MKGLAREQGKPPADMVLDLLIEQDAGVGVVMFYMSEEDVTLGLQSPLTSIDSDGSAISPERGGKPHPRYYGTFPRILGHYVRERKALGLEEAVRKMTSYAAQRLGLEDRGQIREGMWADIVIFSPERIIDRATFTDPHQFPDGIDYVLVNGVVVVEKGQHTGESPGKVLYGPGRKGRLAGTSIGRETLAATSPARGIECSPTVSFGRCIDEADCCRVSVHGCSGWRMRSRRIDPDHQRSG